MVATHSIAAGNEMDSRALPASALTQPMSSQAMGATAYKENVNPKKTV